jgi:TipAS antibiotic-recognition domain
MFVQGNSNERNESISGNRVRANRRSYRSNAASLRSNWPTQTQTLHKRGLPTLQQTRSRATSTNHYLEIHRLLFESNQKLTNSNSFDLTAALNQQKAIIAEKRQQLDLAINAIEKAQCLLATNEEPDWEAFKQIIEVINMQNNMDWTKKYYSEEAQQKLAERAATIPPEVIEQGQRDWATLIREVETAVSEGMDPKSEQAAALADRWTVLIKAFTGGDLEIQAGLNKMYSDQTNGPTNFPKPYSDAVGDFIHKAIAAKFGKSC